MRKQNDKWNILGRRMLVLLLLCGLLMPILTQTNAATVTYEYKWIQSEAGLPTDDQWHDFIIAWEDTEEDNKYWFTDYHWYTASGNNNIDAGGSHWMEYKAASTLPDTTSESFTSQNALGHMQIKYAGVDKDNGNSPKYYIRVSKMNGGYSYFTRYEPTNNEADADVFTFRDKGDVFHIFVNIKGKADRYLTRDGQYLETTESSSYGGGEYYRPLRVYERTYTVDKTEDDASNDVVGKVNLYEYTWVNSAEELLALTKNKDWTNVVLAWEDANGTGTSNPGKVWYTKEVWYDEEGKPNYENASTEYYYWSNDTWGSDGYGSANAESFILPQKVGHFQMKFVGWDDDNPISGYESWGSPMDSPVFQIRFDVGRGKYFYLGNDHFEENAADALNYTVQMRLAREFAEDIYGSVHIFRNMSGDDEYLTRKNNRFDVSNDNGSKYWEYPFRIYTYRPVVYDAVVKSFTIGKGATYSIKGQMIVNEDVAITVEDGGVLAVEETLLNKGKIIVKNGGTVIINDGGCIVNYDKIKAQKIVLDGGNLVIMDGGKLILDGYPCTLEASNGATIWNRGLLVVGYALALESNSYLLNESNAMMLVGGVIPYERGGLSTFSFDEIAKRMRNRAFNYICGSGSKIVNKGTIIQPKDSFIQKSEYFDSCFSNVDGGTVQIRKD